MARVFLVAALLFLLPFLLFAIYAAVMDFLIDPGLKTRPVSAWKNPPLGWLVATGVLCVTVAFLYVALNTSSSGPTTGTYHPPTVKDGKVQPGYVE